MSEFGTAIAARVARTTRSLDAAQDAGDDYLVSVLHGELESLARLAGEHDVEVPGLRQSLERHGEAAQIRLPQDSAEQRIA